MPRKPTTPSDNFRQGYDAGYKDGWTTRGNRSIQDDPSLWNWADWFAYVLATVVVAGIAIVIFGLLTLWISWASDHHDHMHCGITPDNTQRCYHDDR